MTFDKIEGLRVEVVELKEKAEKTFNETLKSGGSVTEARAKTKDLYVLIEQKEEELERAKAAFKEETMEKQRRELQQRQAEEDAIRKAEEDAEREKAKAMWKDVEYKLTSDNSIVIAAKKVLADLKQIQLYPATECVEINDALVKDVFHQSQAAYQKLLNGAKGSIIETKRNKNKRAKTIVEYRIKTAEGYNNIAPFTEFDRAVLNACISEQMAGNICTTVSVIFRHMIGQIGNQNVRPSANQKAAILESLAKLQNTRIWINSETLADMTYKDGNGNELQITAMSLPTLDWAFATLKVNGQVIDDVVIFCNKPLLYSCAESKNQIVRYPAKLLNVPNQNNTPRIITIKKYVMRRICEIKLHKQLVPTITFSDVFKKCGIDNSPRQIQADARNAITQLFEHLQQENFINTFEVVQDKQSWKFLSIKFTFNK